MKRYGICLLLILALAAACIAAGYFATRTKAEPESAISNTTYETESVKENRVVINQKQVEPIAETGLEQSTICLYTHIPITDFPEKEQDRLREGIWFPSMMEVFHYLESYTS